VLGVAAFTPIGFIAALVSLLWILVLSIVLFVREGKEPSIAGEASAASAV
jgi:hypothetical protein